MKIACDFLPQQYKAVRINFKLLFLAGVLWGLTFLVCSYTVVSHGKEIKEVEDQITSHNTTISLIESQMNAELVDQRKVTALIQKFRFIQQAMGSTDYPFLEFFQALEKSVPVSDETGRRRVAITKLNKNAGNVWQLSGTAYHWEDILAFEDRLNASFFEKIMDQADGSEHRVKKKNFRSVRVFSVDTSNEQVTFDMQFEFCTS